MSFRVLVTGSRDWEDFGTIFKALDDAYAQRDGQTMILVHGAARGADLIAQTWYEHRQEKGWDVRIERHPAKWLQLGRRAGPVRNQEMVDLGAEMCLAFPLPESIGTWDCMHKAKSKNIPVREFTPRVLHSSDDEVVET